MSGPIHEDKQISLIDIYFAVIITVGLDRFINDFLKDQNIQRWTFSHIWNILQFHDKINHFPIVLNMALFSSVYLWIVLHWVIYHKLIDFYPYERKIQFLCDIAFFSTVFLILSFSYSANGDVIFSLFVLLFVVLHTVGLVRSLSIRSSSSWQKLPADIRDILGGDRWMHIIWLCFYLILFVTFITALLSNEINKDDILNTIKIIIIFLVLTFSGIRFTRYMLQKSLIKLERVGTTKAPHYIESKKDDKNHNYHWYRIRVKNCHLQKVAINCLIYLESIKEMTDRNAIKKNLNLIEFKWTGTSSKEVNIGPNSHREFDAICVCEKSDGSGAVEKICLGINEHIVDNPEIMKEYTICKPTTPIRTHCIDHHYELTYKLYSLNFEPVEKKSILHFGQAVDNIKLHDENEVSKCPICKDILIKKRNIRTTVQCYLRMNQMVYHGL